MAGRVRLLAVLALLACEQPQPPPPRDETLTAVPDVFDAPVIETPAGAIERVPEWKLDPNAITTVVGSETDDNYLFYNTRFITRMNDGRILVAPAGEELRFFTADGKYISTQGRKGEGPGEFRHIAHLARMPGDTIVTYDRNRISFFDSTGAFVNSFNLTTRVGGQGLSAVTGDGRLYAGKPINNLHDFAGKAREQFALLAFDRKGVPLDTLGIIDGMWMQLSGGGGSSLSLTGFPQVTASGNRVFVTEGDAYEIRVFENAKPLHLIRNLTPRIPVTQQDRDDIARGPAPDTSARVMAARRERAKNALDEHPSIANLIADRAGNVWALNDPPDRIGPAMWHIYGPDGYLIARMQRPKTQGSIREIGPDYVLLTHQKNLALTRIEVLRLIKP